MSVAPDTYYKPGYLMVCPLPAEEDDYPQVISEVDMIFGAEGDGVKSDEGNAKMKKRFDYANLDFYRIKLHEDLELARLLKEEYMKLWTCLQDVVMGFDYHVIFILEKFSIFV